MWGCRNAVTACFSECCNLPFPRQRLIDLSISYWYESTLSNYSFPCFPDVILGFVASVSSEFRKLQVELNRNFVSKWFYQNSLSVTRVSTRVTRWNLTFKTPKSIVVGRNRMFWRGEALKEVFSLLFERKTQEESRGFFAERKDLLGYLK